MNQLSESQEQQELFRVCNYFIGKHPELELLYHIPNEGKRSAATGSRLKREGLKAGIPDLHLPVSRGQYHSLYIELKAGKNQPTAQQRYWLQELSRQNHFAVACKGHDQALQTLLNYLSLKVGQLYYDRFPESTNIKGMLVNEIKFQGGNF